MSKLVAIDPGRKKCGLILTDTEQQVVIDGKVVEADSVIELLLDWQNSQALEGILLGNGTSSDFWYKYLVEIAPVHLVEERGTTLRARNRYWEIWPPKNLYKLLPRGLIVPPGDLDAVAALVLLEDYLQKQFRWPGPPSF